MTTTTTTTTTNVSGLAASIRNATENETFDLAGSNATTIEHIIRDAFTQPFDHLHNSSANAMIRITLITGAGKLGRSKYDEHAARIVTTILRELGYNEDRGASAIIDCAGSYKLQHDTGKNLKTVVIFPKIVDNSTTTATIQNGMEQMKIHNNNGTSSSTTKAIQSFIQEGSVEEKLIQTPLNIFTKMIQSKCETWNQKKLCCQAIIQLKEYAEQIDSKLMMGREPLTDTEQEYYNTISISVLDEKITFIKDLMTKQVESGQITVEEKKLLLDQITDRIKSLTDEIHESEQQKKVKRVETLKQQLDKVQQRQKKIQTITPILPPKLKNEDVILKLRKEQLPLLELEKIAKGRLLSIKESQSLARKEEIDTEIQDLQISSRQWYETDELFQVRVQLSQTNWEKQIKQINNAAKKKTATSTALRGSTNTTAKWVVPGATKGNNNAWNTSTTNKSTTTAGNKKTIPKTSGGLFAAMMNDSDSD